MNDRFRPALHELNAASYKRCLFLNRDEHDVLQLEIGGATVLDFAVGSRNGASYSGIELAEICLGGHAYVKYHVEYPDNQLPGIHSIHVKTQCPLEACIGAQYAGWPISHGDYFAMCSGPIRMLRGKEPILSAYDLKIEAERPRGPFQEKKVEDGKAVGVLETNQLPTPAIIELIADECQIDPTDIVLCVARTASLPGATQIVARSVETAMHKLHELEFDLRTVVSANGNAPLPPIGKDDMVALGRTNDAILYGGVVHLNVDTTDEAVEKILDRLPSCSSPEFGTPFLEIFRRYDHDFYKIDKMLFSPARVTITNEQTGRIFEAGETRPDVLRKSFGNE